MAFRGRASRGWQGPLRKTCTMSMRMARLFSRLAMSLRPRMRSLKCFRRRFEHSRRRYRCRITRP